LHGDVPRRPAPIRSSARCHAQGMKGVFTVGSGGGSGPTTTAASGASSNVALITTPKAADKTVMGRLWPGSPQVTPSTRRAPRRVLPGPRRIRGKTARAACRSACGSGGLGASRHQHPCASIAVRVRKPRSTGLHILTVGMQAGHLLGRLGAVRRRRLLALMLIALYVRFTPGFNRQKRLEEEGGSPASHCQQGLPLRA
jgi:hypothetical protein